ncbi:MAG: hypothetical protein SCH70_10430 [Candidatus Methanoperedens sp.]|nr:hypothetical protein [Candidatus Methanoperedens sp.]
MEERIRNRLALLGSLLVVGLMLAGIGSALGAGTVLQKPDLFLAKISDGNIVISKNNEVIDTLTLEEGKNYTLDTSGGSIRIGYLTKEEMERAQAKRSVELNKLIEIAKKDGEVQKLIEGKNYTVIGTGLAGFSNQIYMSKPNENGTFDLIAPHEGKEKIGFVGLEIEGKYYKVMIDLNSETVKSIEEQASPVMTVCYGEGCNK